MTTTEEDRELRELFAPRRPDPAAFAAGVAAKIRDREATAAGADVDAAAAHAPTDRVPMDQVPTDRVPMDQVPIDRAPRRGLLHRAASILPFEAGFGAAALAKSIWAWLSLPLLLVGGAIAAFTGGVLMVRRDVRAPGSASGGKPPIRLARHACYLLSVVCPLLLLLAAPSGSGRIVDAVLAGAVLSMLALTVMLRVAGKLGYAERSAVATLCLQVLNGLWFGGGFIVLSADALYDEALYKGLAGTAIVLAMLLLAPFVARVLWPMVALAIVTLVALVPDVLGPRQPSPARLAHVVSTAHPDPERLEQWRRLGQIHEALQACGIATTPTAEQREALAATLAAADVHPIVLTAAARLGIVTDAQWRELATRPLVEFGFDQLERIEGPLHVVDYDEWILPAWLATRAPDAAAREHVLGRIAQTWPKDDDAMPIREAALLMHWLELLGRADLAAPHAEWLRAMLARHQAGADRFGAGGFGELPGQRLNGDEEATHRALVLLSRLDDTAPIDHRALRRYLVRTARKGEDLAAADLLWYRRSFGATERSLGEWLVDERLFVGVALLALLCLFATFQTPRAKPVAGTLP